jgi:Ca2+-binding EF-hand superfamily protein
MDKDTDGYVSREELILFYRPAPLGLNDTIKSILDVEEFFSKTDTDKDGKLSSEEVLATAQAEGIHLSLDELDLAFSQIDADADGFISKQELVDYQSKVNDPIVPPVDP